MTEILRGKDVADRLTEKNVIKADELRKGGMCPTLAIVRLGENPGDLSYERGAMKRAAQTGVDVKQFIYDEAITQDELLAELDKINRDDSIHGVLIFRPMPGHIDEKAVTRDFRRVLRRPVWKYWIITDSIRRESVWQS